MNCKLVMVPPPGDWWVEVERERRVAGDVFFKKGQTPLDWRRRASIVVCFNVKIEAMRGNAGVREQNGR